MGFIAPIAGAIGGAGGIGSAISSLGSLLGAVSSFMGSSQPDVPMPAPVNIGPSSPTPELPANPATVMSANEQQAVSDLEKRRLAAGKAKTNAQSTTLAGNQGDATVNRVTLLGG